MNVLKEITEKTGLRIITAGFSCLAPGTVIVPHTGYKGYSSQIYRVHLGLIVPEGDVVLKVGNSQSKWQTGKGKRRKREMGKPKYILILILLFISTNYQYSFSV